MAVRIWRILRTGQIEWMCFNPVWILRGELMGRACRKLAEKEGGNIEFGKLANSPRTAKCGNNAPFHVMQAAETSVQTNSI